MAELENHFRIAYREAVNVRNAPPQDERIVIEVEVGSVIEGDLPDVRPSPSLGIADKANPHPLRRPLHESPEFAEALHRNEAVRLQDELGLKVLDNILGMAITAGGNGRSGAVTGLVGFLVLFVFLVLRVRLWHWLPPIAPVSRRRARYNP